MPTRKIRDLPTVRRCRHPSHNPPGMRVFEPGVYEHTCPHCGQKQVFVVPERPTWCASSAPAPTHWMHQ